MTDTTDDQATEEPQALPGDGLREGIVDELRRRLGEAVVAVELRPNDDLWVRVATDAWAATGQALRSMGFTYFVFLSGLDWLPSPYGRSEENPDEPAPERSSEVKQGVTGGETRFQVFARVLDPVRHVGITVKADVADEAPAIASWHTIWAGANWHERETHEMFGISFTGHPDLRNMYLPTEFEGHPLRKDFPLLSRMIKPWPGIVDVEPMPSEEAEAAAAGSADTPAASDAAADSDAAAPVAEATSPETPPSEEEPASAPEQTADPAAVTDETVEDAPAPEPAPEPEVARSDEAVAATETPTAPDATAAPTAQEPDAGPVDAPADAVAEAPEARPDAEATGATVPVPDVESAPEEGTDVEPPAAAAEGSWSPDIPVADVEGPYGVGSKAPRPDGSAPPDHPIKASQATMRFHVPGSEGYDELVPDVWFDSETTARTAGFVSPFEQPADTDLGGEGPGSGTPAAQMDDRDGARPDSGQEGDDR